MAWIVRLVKTGADGEKQSADVVNDVLMVTRLDRLARSTRDLLNTLATIADRKAGFRSLADERQHGN